jgi:predicted nucleic acid-binding protein
MKKNVIIDTGVLVAYLNRRERLHNWAKAELSKIKPPLLTCEAVIVETCFLLKNTYGANDLIFSLLKTGKILIPFCLIQETDKIEALMKCYENVP